MPETDFHRPEQVHSLAHWEASPAWPNPVAAPTDIVADSASGFGQAGLASHRADGIDEGLWRPPNRRKAGLLRPNGVKRKAGRDRMRDAR